MAERMSFDQGIGPAEINFEGATPGAAAAARGRLAPAPEARPAAAARKPVSKRRLVLGLGVLAALGIGGYEGWHWYTQGRFLITTDDAYVKADMATIAAKVAGHVLSVAVTDNQRVKAGDLLAQIDPIDYRLAVEAAQAKIDTQDAMIARIGTQVEAQRAVIDQMAAQLVAAKADSIRGTAEFERSRKLVASSFGTAQRLEQAQADRDKMIAGVTQVEAQRRGAAANLAVLEAQKQEAVRTRAELKIARDKAARDLSFTEIRAAFDGVIGNRAVQPGQYVQPGTRLLALVPLDSVYVEANFKETQLGGLKPGQTADISVDAYTDRTIAGTVESFAPASGAQFSLLPPENATGNFTKVVQRVPVRIKVPADVAALGLLRPGLSVVATVHTKADEQSDAARHWQ